MPQADMGNENGENGVKTSFGLQLLTALGDELQRRWPFVTPLKFWYDPAKPALVLQATGLSGRVDFIDDFYLRCRCWTTDDYRAVTVRVAFNAPGADVVAELLQLIRDRVTMA